MHIQASFFTPTGDPHGTYAVDTLTTQSLLRAGQQAEFTLRPKRFHPLSGTHSVPRLFSGPLPLWFRVVFMLNHTPLWQGYVTNITYDGSRIQFQAVGLSTYAETKYVLPPLQGVTTLFAAQSHAFDALQQTGQLPALSLSLRGTDVPIELDFDAATPWRSYLDLLPLYGFSFMLEDNALVLTPNRYDESTAPLLHYHAANPEQANCTPVWPQSHRASTMFTHALAYTGALTAVVPIVSPVPEFTEPLWDAQPGSETTESLLVVRAQNQAERRRETPQQTRVLFRWQDISPLLYPLGRFAPVSLQFQWPWWNKSLTPGHITEVRHTYTNGVGETRLTLSGVPSSEQ